MSRGLLRLLPLFVIIVSAVRPDTPELSSEQLTIGVVPSGHAVITDHKAHGHHKSGLAAAREQPSATTFAEIAEKASPEQEVGSHQEEMRACNHIAKLAKFAASSSFFQIFSKNQLKAPEVLAAAPDEEKRIKGLEVTIQGHKYVDGRTCESATDVLQNLIENDRHVELVFMLGTVVATLVALICISVFIGMGLKPVPPKYWKNSVWCCSFSNGFHDDVDVSDELLPVIQKLVDMTTCPEKMGVPGLDGSWQTHKAFKVKKVMRIENGKQWTQYANARKFTPSFFEKVKEMPEELGKRTEAAWKKIRKVHEARESDPDIGPFLAKLGLDASRNELMLFHGSPMGGGRNKQGEIIFPTEEQSPRHAIKMTGFDERLGSTHGRLGAGTYFGDCASKGDEYAGRYHEWKDGVDPGSVGEEAAMFLARVVIGCPYVTTHSMEQLRRPPCTQGHFDAQLDFSKVSHGKPWNEKGLDLKVCDHPRCDCVISDLAIEVDENFREYVLYEKRCYPEFLIIYERLP